MIFSNIGTIEINTERLLLRRFSYSDSFDMLKNWIADPEIQANYGEPIYSTDEEVKELIDKWISRYEDKEFYRWAIVLKYSGENIGQIAFCKVYSDIATAEVEYCIGSAFSGKGYATEALKNVLDFALNMAGFFKVEGFHRIENSISGKVMKKASMKIVESVSRMEIENYNIQNTVCYAITK